MFKILAFSFNLLALVIFNFLLEDVTVDQSLPDRVEEGNEFLVTVTIDKSTITGYAKFQVLLPEGVRAENVASGVAKFNFEDRKAKFVWMTLPEDRIFDITYKIIVTDPNVKEVPVSGTFSYLDENQRMTVDLPSRIVKMGKEEIIIEEIPEAEVSVTRAIKNVSDNLYKITLDIHYENVSGFAKIQDIVPSNSDIKPDQAMDAVFSMLDTKVKFVWMNFPEDQNNLTVSYFIDLTGASSKKISDLVGEFAFIHDGESRKIQITNPEAIDFVDIETPELAAIDNNTAKPDETIEVQPDPQDLIVVGGTPEPVIKEVEEEVLAEEVIEEQPKEIPVTSTPTPENGVVFKVQIMASHKSVNIETYFPKAFGFYDNVHMDSHEGWMKYLAGGFGTYRSARDQREDYKSNYKFRGPFVVAYNNGERITVQEALMITDQKWIN
jgi:hypothetical protein